jgi:hypothetical protein
MPIFAQIALFIVSTIIQVLLAPRPRVEAPQPATEFDAPLAEEGHPVPVVFGEVWLRAPNVVWYGDIAVQPIRSGGGGKK